MCGRYTLYHAEDIAKRFDLRERAQFVSQDNYNVAPRQWLPVVIQRDGVRTVENMQWGFLPAWAKDPAKERRPINTRAENVLQSRMWKPGFLRHRCIVPARGFYEWKPAENGAHKLPYFIRPSDQELFGFAGIYSVWNDAEGHPLYTFSIITTAANKDMEPIHDRMPVILKPDDERVWLDDTADEAEVLTELLRPYPDGQLLVHRVSTDVNDVRNNGDQLTIPVDE